MASESYDLQMLIKLESGVILPTALPTRIWTGPGPIDLDIGDGYGQVRWVGTTFASTETQGVVNIEKTSEGVAKRLSVAVAVDGDREDVRAAIVGADHGPLTTTLLFIAREAAGASLPMQQRSYIKKANADPEPALSIPSIDGPQMLYVGADTFKISEYTDRREEIRNMLVEGNKAKFTGDGGTTVGQTADVEIVYASVQTGTSFDVWTIQTDGHGSFTEASAGNVLVDFTDPFKDQSWSYVADSAGAPLVVRGRTGEMSYAEGMWTFDINNRVHDADRQTVDIWSDATQQSKYPGDTFFQRCASIEAGLDFDWPD